MLLSKKVKIKTNPSNLKKLRKHYPNIKNNEVIEISIEHLSKSSHVLVEVCCDVCLTKKLIEYRLYTRSLLNGKYYACSQKCSKNKTINTNLIKYGEVNPSKSNEIKNKIKQTNIEKYGVENVYQSKEIKEKIKQTNLQRYGVEYSVQSNNIKEKIKQTNLQRYGVENVYQLKEIKEKIKQINLKKYGFEYASQSDQIKEKMSNTCLKKYGVNNPYKSEIVKNKIKKILIDKYGVDNSFKSEKIKEKIKQTNKRRYGVEYAIQNDKIREKQLLSAYKIKQHPCGLMYQGTYEKKFIDFCIRNNIVISKSIPFKYIMNGQNKIYFPDFYYEKMNLIIEIKSTYYYNLLKEKNDIKKQCILNNGYNYILILDNNYDEFINNIL